MSYKHNVLQYRTNLLSSFFFVMAYLYFPETRRKTLEEIAAAFGDKVVEVDETAVQVEHMKMDDEFVEHSSDVKAGKI